MTAISQPNADGRIGPRIVVLGPAKSGKTSLIRAFLAGLTGAGTASDHPVAPSVQGASNGEVVHYPVRPVGSPQPISVSDCDSRAAEDLLTRPGLVHTAPESSALADAVRSCDALVLTVDATAGDAELHERFAALSEFLAAFERHRNHDRRAGGLPVFVTLTKCDALFRGGDTESEWTDRIAARKRDVEARFREWLTECATDGKVESYYHPFGSADLHIAATGFRPASAANGPCAKSGFGVAELVHHLERAALDHHRRVTRARRRLRFTTITAAVATASFAVALAATAILADDPLAARVRAYRDMEGSPAIRLSDRNLFRNKRELESIRRARNFDRLPQEWRAFVQSRLEEIESYYQYRKRFHPPRLGPAEVRTPEELAKLKDALNGELAPPNNAATAWAVPGEATDAVRLWEKWKADAGLLSEAEEKVFDWYRDLIHRANLLLLRDRPPDAVWRSRVADVLAAGDAPRFRNDDPVPVSPVLPLSRGAALTYSTAFAFDRNAAARREWVDTRDHLLNLRDMCDAFGLTDFPGASGSVLALPEPGPGVDSLNLATVRLKVLDAAYPGYAPAFRGWAVYDFPDPVRSWLEPRVRAAFATGVRHVHAVILDRVGRDQPENWKALGTGLLAEPALRDWGTLLNRFQSWFEPNPPPADPVRELAEFLASDRFEIAPKRIEIGIPDDLLGERLVPDGKLTIRVTAAGGTISELALQSVGGVRSEGPLTFHRFEPEGNPNPLLYKPGDGFVVTSPLRAGGRQYELIWNDPRSVVYQFDALLRAPAMNAVGRGQAPLPARDVRVTVDGKFPRLPVLMPEVRERNP